MNLEKVGSYYVVAFCPSCKTIRRVAEWQCECGSLIPIGKILTEDEMEQTRIKYARPSLIVEGKQ